jgi:predicted glutamine amidotransferase
VGHLVAYFGNEPENLACALFSARAALYSKSTRRTNDGFGLGFVQGGDVLLRKRPRAETTEVDLYGLARDTRAEALVGRVGLAQSSGGAIADSKSDASVRAEDADPFRFRSWLFGSVGDVDQAAFEGVRERVLESTPSFLRRNIRGLSASEHFFHLFLAFLHDAGILDQPTPPPTAVHAALRNSLAFVDRLLVSTGAPSLKIALATTNGRCFVATGCAYPMRYLHVEGISDCPVCHAASDRTDPQRSGRRITHEALRAVVVEANRDIATRPGWTDIPDRSALIVGADRVPTISSL